MATRVVIAGGGVAALEARPVGMLGFRQAARKARGSGIGLGF